VLYLTAWATLRVITVQDGCVSDPDATIHYQPQADQIASGVARRASHG
jgi:hypothetical protein